ncbi:MAG: hypothetical protein IPK74_28040 [Deltaproteobacteria bacterium]|nr:hypothetical protein [Deltaproteobacteria bacterium]
MARWIRGWGWGGQWGRGWLGVAGLVAGLTAAGCTSTPPGGEGDSSSGDDDSATSATMTASGSTSIDPSTTSGGEQVGWFELGWGDTEFHALQDGDTLQVVWGGQGAAMFPLPLRGGEFTLPDPPDDYTSPLAPMFDLTIDIEGHNDGVGGHFKYLANYPITFDILPDGSYEFVYVAVLLPDGLDPAELDGLPAHLHARLRPVDSAAFDVELDLIVANAPPPV